MCYLILDKQKDSKNYEHESFEHDNKQRDLLQRRLVKGKHSQEVPAVALCCATKPLTRRSDQHESLKSSLSYCTSSHLVLSFSPACPCSQVRREECFFNDLFNKDHKINQINYSRHYLPTFAAHVARKKLSPCDCYRQKDCACNTALPNLKQTIV